VLTAAITGAVAAVLNLFGIEPGAYLVGVAIGVKAVIVAAGLLFGVRWLRKRPRGEAGGPPAGR
jgi:amino acid transporter